MSNRVRMGWACGALLASGLACSQWLSAAADKQPAQRLAIVNVSYVFSNYKKIADVQRLIDNMEPEEKKYLDLTAKDLKARQEDLAPLLNMANADLNVFDRVQKLRRDQFVYATRLRALNDKIQKQYTKEMRDVLSDIRLAIVAVSKDRFDVVLRSPDPDEASLVNAAAGKTGDKKAVAEMIEPKTTVEVLERFNRNPVLFGRVTVDITHEVLDKLNRDYARRTGVGGQ